MSRFPLLRMRRLRDGDFIRRLTAESRLTVDDLIWPLFVHDAPSSEAVPSMPGVFRLSLDDLWRAGERAQTLGIPLVAVFPVIAPEKKNAGGTEAENPDGLAARAVAGLKQRFPTLGVMADIALDPYTVHGHDGLVGADGAILNDETVAVLQRQALAQAAAGADVLAPSDMMDGRIGAIRQALEEGGGQHVKILAYAAKYASSFYGPFRAAVGAAALRGETDKRTYQMNPANIREAMREIELDIAEGADMVMIKPGMPYLDVVAAAAARFDLPVLAYQVSGEYAMLRAAADNGWLDGDACMMESLLAFKRAGASAVLSYFAADVAARLAAARLGER